MRFIKNEHRAGAVLIQPIPQWRRILLVAQEGVRNDKLRMGGPGIDRVTAFTSAIKQIISVENNETQAEAGLHFVLPLGDKRRRARDHDSLHLLAHYHFAENQSGLDRFSQADVVSNEKVDARHL